MSTRRESWSERTGGQGALLAAAAGIALFFAAWAAIHYGFYARGSALNIVDTPEYERYGDAIAAGSVPYRDFHVEYPPGALPAFVLPSLDAKAGDFQGFRRLFEALMAACGAAAIGFVALVLVRGRAGPPRLTGAICLVALAPLALGSVMLSRYDLWPAALTAAALAALIGGREPLGLGILGLGAAAKVYPAVLLPIALAYTWRRSGRARALAGLGSFAAVALACVVPFFALAPRGVWDSIVQQTTRPLQVESLGSSFLLAAHHVGGLGLTATSSHGSQNLAGSTANVIAAVQSVLEILALLAIWTWFARGPADRERFLRASAAAVCAFVALGKVVSPQFLIWLVPLVPLVGGRRGLKAGGLLVVAMVLTQLWFPYRYWRLALGFDELASWLVLVRDLVLVALLAVLVWPERLKRTEAPATRTI
jgi:hypothetical protein